MTVPPVARGRQTAWLVYNSASGNHIDGLEADIAARLVGADIDLVRSFDCQTEEMPDAATAGVKDVSIIIVHGGDGTMNAIVKGLAGWGGTILPLPGGTANLLCHRLFDQCDWEVVMNNLVAGALTRRRIDAVFCERHIALSEMLAGPAALWADAREELRERDLSGVVAATKEAANQSSEGAFVCIVEPQIGREDGYPGIRFSPQGGGLQIQGYVQENVMDLIKQGIAIVTHDFRQGPHDNLGREQRVVCRSVDSSPIELMIDGERASVASETEISLGPLEVDLFCSAQT